MQKAGISLQKTEALHHKYAPNNKVYDLVYGHCRIICEIALWCASNVKGTKVNVDLLQTAALLHDIGAYILFDEEGKVANSRMYRLHAILGAKIVADEGIDMRISKIIETHPLLGLTQQEIVDASLPLPFRNYEPDTIEGELLCYADRFHSKLPVFNAYDNFLLNLKENLPLQAAKFEAMSKRFGIPDVNALANKYNQPIY